VAKIKLGLAKDITLGNLAAKRDWGFAGDYVEAMWAMVQKDEPGDYVIATGKEHSIGDVLDIAFQHVGINDYMSLVKSDPRFKRTAELHALRGNPQKAIDELDWNPQKTTFEQMIQDMVDADIKRLS
jgi:GDPmannose 4,6-dehydratase